MMSQGKKIRYLQQGPVEKYGRVPPKAPVNIIRRSSVATQPADQQKPNETSRKNVSTNK